MSEISVILPTYNRAPFIKRSVESILRQTFGDFELIIVDDGSTDSTEEIVRSITDPRIVYVRHSPNRGAAVSRNEGLKLATGKYIAFHDSDDEAFPERLEEGYKALSASGAGVGLVYSGAYTVIGGRKYRFPVPRFAACEYVYPKALRYGLYNIPLITCMLRREVFDKAGTFSLKQKAFIDLEFFMRVSRHYRFDYIDKPLAVFYFTEGCITSDMKNVLSAKKRIFVTYYGDIKNDRRAVSAHFREIGHSYCMCGNVRKGRKFLLAALETDIRNAPAFLYLVFSVSGKGYKGLFGSAKKVFLKLRGLFPA